MKTEAVRSALWQECIWVALNLCGVVYYVVITWKNTTPSYAIRKLSGGVQLRHTVHIGDVFSIELDLDVPCLCRHFKAAQNRLQSPCSVTRRYSLDRNLFHCPLPDRLRDRRSAAVAGNNRPAAETFAKPKPPAKMKTEAVLRVFWQECIWVALNFYPSKIGCPPTKSI